jgi:hypothetical protein
MKQDSLIYHQCDEWETRAMEAANESRPTEHEDQDENAFEYLLPEAAALLHDDGNPENAVTQLRLKHEELKQDQAEFIVQAAQELSEAPVVRSLRRTAELKQAGLYLLGALLAGAFPKFIAPLIWGKEHGQGMWYFVAAGALVVSIISFVKAIRV